jgi:hypothetical protein
MTENERVPRLKPESRDKFIDSAVGIRILDRHGNLLEVIGKDEEDTRQRTEQAKAGAQR